MCKMSYREVTKVKVISLGRYESGEEIIHTNIYSRTLAQ